MGTPETDREAQSKARVEKKREETNPKTRREVRRQVARTREFDTLRDLCNAVLISDGSGAVTERERLRAWGNIVTLAKVARQLFEAQNPELQCRCHRSTGLRADLEPCEPGECPAVFVAEREPA